MIIESGKKNGRADDDDFDFMPEKLLEVYKESVVINKYRVFIDEAITDPSKYRSIINILEQASENDVVEFRLNTPGGNVFTALQICNAIENSAATTVAIADGIVASAGTFFLLSCDDVVIMNNTLVMVHPCSFGAGGDMKYMRDFSKFQTEYLESFMHEMYEGFMTEEEIKDTIESSKEYWMKQDEVISRLKRRQQLQLEAVKAAMEEEEDETPPPPPKKETPARKPRKKKGE